MAEAKFLAARKFRAARLGITPDELSRQQEEFLEASNIGGPECLSSEELAELAEGAEPDPSQVAHLRDCSGCQTTLALLEDEVS
jgi:hypothetical protein